MSRRRKRRGRRGGNLINEGKSDREDKMGEKR